MKALPPRASEENLNLQGDKASTKYLRVPEAIGTSYSTTKPSQEVDRADLRSQKRLRKR
jgi:hypothetical protein